MHQPRDVNVTALIDDRPMGGLQWLVFVLCALAALLDGADSQSIGVAGPLIAAQFGMTMGSFTPAFSVGLLGATIGDATDPMMARVAAPSPKAGTSTSGPNRSTGAAPGPRPGRRRRAPPPR